MPAPKGKTPRGMKPSVENPGQILKRMMGYIFKFYKIQMIFVFILVICVSSIVVFFYLFSCLCSGVLAFEEA